MKAPDDCCSMADLRVQIDALDAQVVALLAQRAAYIDRAIDLKPAEALPARIGSRVEDVVAKVRAEAVAQGLDPALVERMWRLMIEWSIAREEMVLGASPKEAE